MSAVEAEEGGAGQFAGIDRVVHEPARLAILTCLSVVAEADFLFLQRQTGLTGGNLSAHISRLEAEGYVAVKKEFAGKTPRTLLRATRKGLDAFRGYRHAMLRALRLPAR